MAKCPKCDGEARFSAYENRFVCRSCGHQFDSEGEACSSGCS